VRLVLRRTITAECFGKYRLRTSGIAPPEGTGEYCTTGLPSEGEFAKLLEERSCSITGSMNTPRLLSDDDFAHIVRHAPLVSIDIVIKDPEKNVLLGLRTNEPAKGTYFVPGGVIRKNETIRDAFARILKDEIGLQTSLDEATFLGVFEHFYETNCFDSLDYGTHYVVLAYELNLKQRPLVEPNSQHMEVRWMSEVEIHSTINVDPNTKAYFL
jgi:colanic acid biosynthesis protein WcaH